MSCTAGAVLIKDYCKQHAERLTNIIPVVSHLLTCQVPSIQSGYNNCLPLLPTAQETPGLLMSTNPGDSSWSRGAGPAPGSSCCSSRACAARQATVVVAAQDQRQLQVSRCGMTRSRSMAGALNAAVISES